MKVPQKLAGETDQDAIRLKMEMEIDFYLQMLGIGLRGQNRAFMDPLVWWERMEERTYFPILSQMTKAFLEIPATSASLERMRRRSGKILLAKTVRLKTNVTLASMFLAETAEVLRMYYKQIVETFNNPVPLDLTEAGKRASAANVDVGQDLF